MSRLEKQLSPLKQQTRAPRDETTRVHNNPILAGLDAFNLSTIEVLHLQAFADGLLCLVAAWRHAHSHQKGRSYERA